MTQNDFEHAVMDMTGEMYRVCAGILPSLHDRQDAVQDAVLRAWRSLNGLRDDAAFKPWMMSIVVHACYALLKRRKREQTVENRLALEREIEPNDGGRDEALHAALMRLKPKLRMTVILYYMEGYAVNDVAAILHIPRGTVKSRLSAARVQLKSMLDMEV